jgi:hypothetical protein
MASAYDLLVKIDASTAALRRELGGAEGAVTRFRRNVQTELGGIDRALAGVNAAFGTLGRVAGTLGIGIGISQLVSLGRSAIRAGDDIGDMAGQLQIGAEQLQELRFAARETGVEAGTLDQAIARITTRIGEAAAGQENAVRSFNRLNIEFKNADGAARSTEAVLRDLADRIRALPDPASRAAAAAELLGDRAGPRLVALLAQGSSGLDDFAQAARDAGQVMSEETIQRLGEAEDAIERFKTRLTVIVGETIGLFQRLSDEFNNSDFIRSGDENILRSVVAVKEGEIAKLKSELDEIVAQRNRVAALGIFDEEVLAAEDRQIAAITEAIKGAEEAASKARGELLAFLREGSTPQGHSGRGGSLPPKPGTLDLGDDGTTTTRRAAATRELSSALDQLNASLRQQIDLAGLSARQSLELETIIRAQAAAQQDYNNGLRDSPILTGEELEAVKSLTGGISDLAEAREAATAAAANAEKANAALANVEANTAGVEEWAGAYGTLESASSNAIFSILSGTESARGALAGLLNDLARLFLQQALFGGSGQGGGLFGGLFGLIFGGGSAASPLYSVPGTLNLTSGQFGHLQHGGRAQKGRPYIVGELRPELFVPDENGVVIPSVPGVVPSGGMAAMGGPTVAVSIGAINIETNGGGTPQQNADLAEKASAAVQRAFAQVVDERITHALKPRGLLNPNLVG